MKETNLDCSNKFNSVSYPSKGIFKNTDNNGFIEILLNDGSFVLLITPNQLEVIESYSKDIELPELPTVEIQDNKVSEDFALKAMAIVMNKESYNECK